MDKSSSLGMSPGHPKKYPRGSSVKAWGCSRHPRFISKKHQVIFQCAIFLLLHALCVILGASLFSVVCLVFNKVGPHHSFVLERDTLHLHSSLVFLVYYLWELFQISRLVLDTSEKFYSDANGSCNFL